MDAENDNDQPNSSSSASSSNNSSSSNLLVNLPMLPMLHDDDDDVELAEPQPRLQRTSRLSPTPSASPAVPTNVAAASVTHAAASSQQQPGGGDAPQADNSIFISPLLFNNNSSSSSSTTSSTSHNLHLYHHQQHFEHEPHHQHSPSPSHQPTPPPPQPPLQHLAPSSPYVQPEPQHQRQEQQAAELQQQPNPIDDNAIADTIDASTVEAANVEDDDDEADEGNEHADAIVDLNADIASTSQQQQQRLTARTGVAATIAAGTAQPHTPPTSLPLLLQDAAKPTTSPHFTQHHHYPYSSTPHAFHHPHHFQHYPLFGAFGSGSGSNNNNIAFNFDATNRINGAIMFSHSDTSGGGGPSGSNHHHHQQHQATDRLKMLYPNVNESETPLPRCWSPHDKCLSIGLSQNNLRVHYKGVGKQPNDAASVRTAYPIPPACGLYYFEVKIISKGKNGYMGIGLTAQQFRMNRLPGWDKQSYGYHGDDGNSFSSSGNGQSYGPTFTTGDIIGCCVNFVNNTCFYTKNGIDLGIAFRDLPSKLYPTVGLQTPGEEVDANFGQEPFKFDQIEDMMKQMRAEMRAAIYDFPMAPEQGDPTTLLHKMVSSYLVHNGYTQTAEAFAHTTGQTFREDLSSIKNRQKILKLVMSGKMGQAIELTLRSYPGLLENNKNLWFMLKCRQFIEMVNGSDIEYCPTTNNKLTNSTTTQTQTTTPPNQTSVIQSTKSYQNGKAPAPGAALTSNNAQNTTAASTAAAAATTTTGSASINPAVINTDDHQQQQQEIKSSLNSAENCSGSGDATSNSKSNSNIDYDIDMDNNSHTNGNSCKNGNSNNFNSSLDVEEEMDIDMSPATQKLSHGIERILEFGKELSQMGQQLEKENQMNEEDRQMLEDAFSLIAYSNPWSSPLGWQLCPTKRETVCTALNSAILESMSYPRRPPLDVCVAHAAELLKVMAQTSLGACAFVNIEDIFSQN